MNVTRNSLTLACVVVAMCTAYSVRADFTFGEPVEFGSIVYGVDINCFPSDGLEMYIDLGFGTGNGDLWVLKRASVDDDWGPPVNLGPSVNSSQEDVLSSISADGLTLYFQSNRSGGFGGTDIYVTTRASRSAPWGPAVNMGPTINSSATDADVWISTNGLELYFLSYRSGGHGLGDIWVARRATENDLWGVPVNLGLPVNSGYREHCPSLSPDGLLLLFSDPYDTTSPRPGGYGGADMWMSRRASLSDPWQTPVNLGPKVNGPGWQALPRISPDGSTLYFVGTRSGAEAAWQAPIIPIVDFNGDEIVDVKDLVMLIEHWGQANAQCDIGPMPWGDGKVDAADLEVLMSYWQQEVLPSIPVGLIAYWKLNEVDGTVAIDSTGTSDGVLVGDPLWQPARGKVKGALQFDGIDDYVSTAFVVNPSKGPFSVFAWVQGGAPGQAILSQDKGTNWLMAGDPDGVLATGLKESERKGKPLVSAAVITDGAWHRVGFVWDGSDRILYVDDVEIAMDAVTSLGGSTTGGLHIGAGKGREPGSFWSGLIDDVRIYNCVVEP